ncbi:NACHT domain-containing protein [Candidatus Thiosymbion oneisti]|uniref:NACHT domain-containing protein n=1 Tax=Candidatus Thiosymbion oneisti TaxID=589554 RepID=UPI000B7E2E51|nr:SUMF1/EgtB/PvdO family nonheme iron enzyme [Candidatus Thiosymbion oneisti]
MAPTLSIRNFLLVNKPLLVLSIFLVLLALLLWINDETLAAILSTVFAGIAAIPVILQLMQHSESQQHPSANVHHYLDQAAEQSLDLPLEDIFGDRSLGSTAAKLPTVYVPLDVERLSAQDILTEHFHRLGKERAEGRPVLRAIDEAISGHDDHPQGMRAVLLGEAGSGKSALSTFLVWGSRHLPDADPNLEWPHSLQKRVIVRLNLSTMRRFIRSDLRPGLKRESRQLLESAVVDAIGTTMPDWNEEQCKSLYKPLLEELRRYGMVIFDGLDEVLNADDRGLICRTIMETAETLGSQCALLVTARPYDSPDGLEGFALWRLLPLSFPHASADSGQVGLLVRRWHQILCPTEAKPQSEALIAALHEDEDRRDMVVRPLLLTLLIGVHHKRRQQPERTALPRIRVDLLNEATQLMIERWFQCIDRNNNEPSARQIPDHILNLLRPEKHSGKSELRRLAEEISFTVQCRRRGETDGIEISRADFIEAIMERLPEIKGKEINSSVQLILDRTALWFPRGHDEEANRSMYAYIHRQFQEFLAACRIVDPHGKQIRLADRLRTNPAAWREVTRLAVVWTARVRTETAALELVQGLLELDEDPDVGANAETEKQRIEGTSKYQAMLAAGWALLDLHKAMDHSTLGRRQTVTKLWNAAGAYRDGFIKMVCDPEVPRRIRLEAGEIAGMMGTQVGATLTQLRVGSGDTRTDPVIADILDIRPGIIPRAWTPTKTAGFALHIQDFDWIPIERRVWITRYPITWAQYDTFLRSGAFDQAGSVPPEHWDFSEPAKNWWWLNHHRRTGQDMEPNGSARIGDRLPNHRAAGIGWFDAIAFCRWLSAQWKPTGGCKLRLPTLAEWEKALAGWNNRGAGWRPEAVPADVSSVCAVGLYEPEPDSLDHAAAAHGQSKPSISVDLTGTGFEWILTKQDPKRIAPLDGSYQPGGPQDSLEGGDDRHILGGIAESEGNPRDIQALLDHRPPNCRDPNIGFRICMHGEL